MFQLIYETFFLFFIQPENVNFFTFTIHMFVGIIFVSLASYALLRLVYRNMEDLENKDPPEVTGENIGGS